MKHRMWRQSGAAGHSLAWLRAACWSVLGLGWGALGAHAGATADQLGVVMVTIPAGSFMMGSCRPGGSCERPDPDAQKDEMPQHRVHVPAFQMGKTEITLGQFKAFIAAAGRQDLLSADFLAANAYGDDVPVVMVRWHDAQAFIAWFNQVDGGGYRLPSEAEWEYACRAGGRFIHCGDDDIDLVGWYRGNSDGRPRAVGRKWPNAWGLHDMSGNVWEWVQDCGNEHYVGAPADGMAWNSGKCSGRGLRGGSWKSPAKVTRANFRLDNAPDERTHEDGFRLARTLRPPEPR